MTAAAIIISVPGIIALVTLVKAFGVTGKWAMLAAFVLGIALNVAALYAGVAYVGKPLFEAAAAGALAGLAASGIYDVSVSGYRYLDKSATGKHAKS